MRSAATLALLPLALAAPAKRAETSCAGPQAPTWTFEGPDYRASYLFSTPAHQISNGFVSFNVSNSMLPYDVTCSATSGQLQDFFYGNVAYECKMPAGFETDSASFTYASITNTLDFSQNYTCTTPEGEIRDYKVHSVTGGPDKRTCEETTYQNFNWTVGATYSSKIRECKGVQFSEEPPFEFEVAEHQN